MRFPATLRPLARSPVLCIAVVLTLALGAVAQTTTFRVVNAAVWRGARSTSRDASRCCT